MVVQLMSDVQLGDAVVYRERTYVVRGFSSMAVLPRRYWLEDAATGETIEALVKDVAPTDGLHEAAARAAPLPRKS